ncbi:ead/Ea22-like family protein [Enterobacter hormaechei]|uniref:ead/Ea22-like family protein n=1 Tax=Enterobacter cloacae complex TaxID=354276 RepID=UPI00197AD4DF|nr:ead/Ea22-like family protein [Enterobacter hormaechei]WMA77632.1 hypothetical protein QPR74_10195 [Enterobacter hormaechei]WMA82338.1 hypothetical protein QPR70_10210 [Enterobacter hormaechei]HCT6444717.1 hypothetical protein [Enterobacter hormaechei]
MSSIDKQALREAAENASTDSHTQDEWFHYLRCSTPETVLALLDELEATEKQLASWRSLAKKNIEEHEKAVAALDTARHRICELESKLTQNESWSMAAQKYIAELEAREVNGRFPLPKDSSQGWKIDPEFISKIQDAIGHDEECQCWEGSPSMEMVEVVLIAAAAIKMDERG